MINRLLGYAGDTCSVNIDDCQSEPCLNGATCEDRINAYVCHCHRGTPSTVQFLVLIQVHVIGNCSVLFFSRPRSDPRVGHTMDVLSNADSGRYADALISYTCLVPRTLSSYGDRTFAAAGPRLWSSLPVQLRNPDITYGLF